MKENTLAKFICKCGYELRFGREGRSRILKLARNCPVLHFLGLTHIKNPISIQTCLRG